MGTRNIVQNFAATDDDFQHLTFTIIQNPDDVGVLIQAQLRQEPVGGGPAIEPKCVLPAAGTIKDAIAGTPNSVFTAAGVTRAQARAFLAEMVKHLRTVAGVV